MSNSSSSNSGIGLSGNSGENIVALVVGFLFALAVIFVVATIFGK